MTCWNASARMVRRPLDGEVAVAMVGRGHVLIALNRTDEAINAWLGVVDRFGKSELSQNRRTGGLGTCERRHGALPVGPARGGRSPRSMESCRATRDAIPRSFGRLWRAVSPTEATCWPPCSGKRKRCRLGKKLIRRFETGGLPDVAEQYCNALMNKAAGGCYSTVRVRGSACAMGRSGGTLRGRRPDRTPHDGRGCPDTQVRPAGAVGPVRRSARGLAAGRGPVREQ